MAHELDECFERIRQAALPGMEEAGNDAPEAARQKPATPVTVKEIVQEKFEVITILNKWLINAKVRNKQEAASDCGKIIRFINKVCAW